MLKSVFPFFCLRDFSFYRIIGLLHLALDHSIDHIWDELRRHHSLSHLLLCHTLCNVLFWYHRCSIQAVPPLDSTSPRNWSECFRVFVMFFTKLSWSNSFLVTAKIVLSSDAGIERNFLFPRCVMQ